MFDGMDFEEINPGNVRERFAKLRLENMNEPQLRDYMNLMMKVVDAMKTADTVGAMIIVFQEDMITQYVASVDPETTPQALRELADRIESRTTVRRI